MSPPLPLRAADASGAAVQASDAPPARRRRTRRSADPAQPRTRLTRPGHFALASSAALLACALNTGTNLLYVLLGSIVGAVALNFLALLRGLGDLEVERRAPRQATAGVAFGVEYRLFSATGREPLFALGVEEAPLPSWQLASGPARLLFESLPGGEARAEVRVVLTRLGRNLLPPIRVVARGPFGFFERTRLLYPGGEVLVLPPVRALAAGALPPLKGRRGLQSRGRGQGEERRDALRSLRELRPGDDQRAIHWRSSARRGQLVIKEFERATPSALWLVVELAGAPRPARWDEASLEEDVPAYVLACERTLILAASFASACAARGVSVGLALAAAPEPLALAPQPGRAALERVLRALAGAGPSPQPRLERLWSRCGGASEAIVFSSRASEGEARGVLPASLRQAPLRLGVEAERWLATDALAPSAPPLEVEA